MQLGPFAVECSRFPHIPVPGLEEIAHAVYWISAAGKSVYVTADAQIDTTCHRAILRGRRADAAFWNGQYLSHPETRELLLEAAEKNFIYHIPVDERMPAVSAANVSAIWPASAQTFRAFLCWSNTRRFWRYEAKNGGLFRRGCFKRASGGPIFSASPEKMGRKALGYGLVRTAGAIQAGF